MALDRRQIALLAVGLLTVTAGCSGGLLSGDGPIEFSASPVSIGDAALQEAGFEEVETRSVTVNRTVNIQDQERKVIITNHVAGYRLAEGQQADAPVGVVAVSTPQAQAFGFALNPVANMGIKDAVNFASQAGSQFGGELRNVEEVGSWKTTVLGKETTVTKFGATVERNGQTVDVFVHATKVKHGDDIVLVVAAYPQALEEAGAVSQESIAPMFEGVEHETDSEDES
ncbi:MAG: DUF6517 family protein [Halobacteriaceae archaeon]